MSASSARASLGRHRAPSSGASTPGTATRPPGAAAPPAPPLPSSAQTPATPRPPAPETSAGSSASSSAPAGPGTGAGLGKPAVAPPEAMGRRLCAAGKEGGSGASVHREAGASAPGSLGRAEARRGPIYFSHLWAFRGATSRYLKDGQSVDPRPPPFLSRRGCTGMEPACGPRGRAVPASSPALPATPPRPRARALGFPTPRADNSRSLPAFSVTGTSTCARPSHDLPRACRRSARKPGRVRAHRPHPLHRYWSERPPPREPAGREGRGR